MHPKQHHEMRQRSQAPSRIQLKAKLAEQLKEDRDIGGKLAGLAMKPEQGDDDVTERNKLLARRQELVGEIDATNTAIDALPDDDVVRVPASQRDTQERLIAAARRSAPILSVAAMLHDRASDHGNGALAELQQEYRLRPTHVPVELVAQAGLTAAPANVETSENAAQLPLFHMSDAAFLGVDTPVVESGEQTWPSITVKPDVGGPHTDGTDIADTQLTIAAEALAPARIGASVKALKTQMLRMPQMEAALRATLDQALAEARDKQIVGEVLTVTEVDASGAVLTFATAEKNLVSDSIDGLYAGEPGDLRVLAGSGTYAALAGLYRTDQSEVSATDRIAGQVGGFRVSPHIPAIADKKQPAIVAKRMGRSYAVCPVWRGVEITLDEITRAGAGEVEIFATMYHQVSIRDAAGFRRVLLKLSA